MTLEVENKYFVDKICQYIHPALGLQYQDIPENVIAGAKNQILSMVAAILHGKKSKYFAKLDIPPVGGDEKKWATLFATLSMIYDYDDFMFAGHTGHSSVTIPLAFSKKHSLNGRSFLTTQVMSNELGGRLGGSIFFGPHNGQLWSPIHQFIAAAIFARLNAENITSGDAGLDVIRRKIYLSLAYPVYPLFDTFFSSSAKIFTAAMAVSIGIEMGLQGDIEGPEMFKPGASFYDQFCYLPLMSVWHELGDKFYSDTLSFKKYPGCAYIAGPVETCEKIFLQMNEKETHSKEIQKVVVYCNLLSKKMNDLSKPYIKGKNSSTTSLNFSLPINCALMLLDGHITPASFEQASIDRHELWQLAEKIKIVHAPKESARMLRYSSMIDDAGKILLRNYFRLKPYRKKYGLGKDLFSILPDMIRSPKFTRYHNRVEKKLLLDKYHLLNGAVTEVTLKGGKKLGAAVELPDGFAGSDPIKTKEFLVAKLQSATTEKTFKKLISTIDNWENLSSLEVSKFVEELQNCI